jgi:hypothetical protein
MTFPPAPMLWLVSMGMLLSMVSLMRYLVAPMHYYALESVCLMFMALLVYFIFQSRSDFKVRRRVADFDG